MIEAKPDKGEEGKTASGPAIGFLNALSVLVQWRNFILVNVLVVTTIAVVVSLLLPKWYRATASILPPKERDVFGAMGSASSILKGLTGRGAGQGQNSYNYFAILKSRTAKEAVVRRFGLLDVYGIRDSSMESGIKELTGNTAFEVQDDDNITVDVLDKDPQRAADMANYFVELLNSMSIDLATREARNNREFIERRVLTTRQDLRAAEDSLQRYQERSGMIIVPQESGTGVSAVAELYGMKAKKEIELAIYRRSISEDNPKVRQLEVELAELQKQLARYPEIGIGSLRLYRNMVIQQKILEYLMPLFEQAKVDEQKDVPVLLVLDKAIVTERKVKPQRMFIVFLAATLSLFSFILFAFLLHGFTRRTTKMTPLEDKLQGYSIRIAARYKIRLA